MKNYAKVQLLNIDNNKIAIKYRGHFIRKYLTDERSLYVLIDTSPQDSKYKYYTSIRHYKTWWGIKRYMNKMFEKSRTPSTFYK